MSFVHLAVLLEWINRVGWGFVEDWVLNLYYRFLSLLQGNLLEFDLFRVVEYEYLIVFVLSVMSRVTNALLILRPTRANPLSNAKRGPWQWWRKPITRAHACTKPHRHVWPRVRSMMALRVCGGCARLLARWRTPCTRPRHAPFSRHRHAPLDRHKRA